MTIGIVGFGRFGQLWAQALSSFGQVLVYEERARPDMGNPDIRLTSLAEVISADIVFLLVPISEFERSCLMIREWLHPETLLVDCCSVKMHPVSIMNRIFPPEQAMLATHPLFGPNFVARNGGLSGGHMVLCPMQEARARQRHLETLLREMGLIIHVATAEEHDRQMATSQSLLHFLGHGLQVLDLHHQDMATPNFEQLLGLSGMVSSDGWQLFLDMHRYNPYAAEVRKKLLNHLIYLDGLIDKT